MNLESDLDQMARPKIINALKTDKPRARRGSIHVYETLREEILWLKIDPGSAIDEVTLAERFEFSRTPIREALMLLVGEELVQFLPNRTTIVAPMSLNNMSEYLDVYLLLSRAVVCAATQNYHAECAESLGANLACLLDSLATEPGPAVLRVDLILRHQLGQIAQNTFLYRNYCQILDMGIRMKILFLYPNSSNENREKVAQRWVALVDAIQDNNAELADQHLTALIMSEGDVILQSLKPKFGHKMPIQPQVLD